MREMNAGAMRCVLVGCPTGRASATSQMRRRFVFFFQAEDGIRYVAVTGVQTCALPIFRRVRRRRASALRGLAPSARGAAGRVERVSHADFAELELLGPLLRLPGPHDTGARSEERRVGKECRSRWSPYH